MYVKKNQLGRNRIGISVSKKVGNSVVRHHLARLIRESYRLHEEEFQCGMDVVVIARVNAKNCTYFEIEGALLHLGKLHHILKETENEDGIDKRYPVLSEVPVSSEEGALPLYADLLAVRAGSDSEIWCFQRKSAGIMENTEM